MTSKASKRDIAAVKYLHVDADPSDDETAGQFLDRIYPIVDNFPIPPTLIVVSGNGIQLLWRLKRRIKLEGDFDGEAAWEEVEQYSPALALGTDPAPSNIDRILAATDFAASRRNAACSDEAAWSDEPSLTRAPRVCTGWSAGKPEVRSGLSGRRPIPAQLV